MRAAVGNGNLRRMSLSAAWKRTTLGNKATMLIALASFVVSLVSACFTFQQNRQTKEAFTHTLREDVNHHQLEFFKLVNEDNASMPDLYPSLLPSPKGLPNNAPFLQVNVSNNGSGDALSISFFDETQGKFLFSMGTISAGRNATGAAAVTGWSIDHNMRIACMTPARIDFRATISFHQWSLVVEPWGHYNSPLPDAYRPRADQSTRGISSTNNTAFDIPSLSDSAHDSSQHVNWTNAATYLARRVYGATGTRGLS